MINLKEIITKYPECLEGASKLRSYLVDLYPEEKSRIRIIIDSFDCGVYEKIKDADVVDKLLISGLCKKLEKEFGYSATLSRWCVDEWSSVFDKNTPSINLTNTVKEKSCESVEAIHEYKNIKVGEIIRLGTYPQGAYGEIEPIEWQVLSVENDKALVISKYILDCKPFNEKLDNVTWGNCYLRKWLNESFYNVAFNNEDKLMILQSRIKADQNPIHFIWQGIDTQDYVFLLSGEETEKYFLNDDERISKLTEYSGNCSNALKKREKDYYFWWTRTVSDDFSASIIDAHGVIDYEGDLVKGLYDLGVRPAMWITVGGCEADESNIKQDIIQENKVQKSEINVGKYESLKIGDVIKLGTYPQGENGEIKPIEWQVLNIKDGKALVISKYALDNMSYNTIVSTSDHYVTDWKKVSLRKWLNTFFYQKAFSENDKSKILLSEITADQKVGPFVQDKVFILSKKEILNYFDNFYKRTCAGTPYCFNKATWKTEENNIVGYWLCSYGGDNNLVACVSLSGDISSSDVGDCRAVRPAMWIKI